MLHPKISFTRKAIQDLSAEVLFNYTNTDFLPMGKGAFSSILGIDPNVAAECAHRNVKPGTASMSGAAGLPYKHICHFVLCGIGNDPTEMSISNSMRWGFQLLSELKHTTYVVPALYEEAGGMPCDLCANILLRELVVFSENKFVDKIQIQVEDKTQYSSYLAMLKKLINK